MIYFEEETVERRAQPHSLSLGSRATDRPDDSVASTVGGDVDPREQSATRSPPTAACATKHCSCS